MMYYDYNKGRNSIRVSRGKNSNLFTTIKIKMKKVGCGAKRIEAHSYRIKNYQKRCKQNYHINAEQKSRFAVTGMLDG